MLHLQEETAGVAWPGVWALRFQLCVPGKLYRTSWGLRLTVREPGTNPLPSVCFCVLRPREPRSAAGPGTW